jgi:hypothetical protein
LGGLRGARGFDLCGELVYTRATLE